MADIALTPVQTNKIRPGQMYLIGKIESKPERMDDGRWMTVFITKRVDDYDELKSYKIFSPSVFGQKDDEQTILVSSHSKVMKPKEYTVKGTGEVKKFREDYVRFDLVEVLR